MLYNENFLDFFEDNKKNKNIFEIQKICANVVLDKLENKDGGLLFGGLIAAGGMLIFAKSAAITCLLVGSFIPGVNFIVAGIGAALVVTGVAIALISQNKDFKETSNTNQQTVTDIENSNTQSIIEDGQALRDQELQKIKDEQAQHQDKIPEEYKTGDNGAVIDELQAPVISNPYLNNNSTSGNAQSSNGLTQPTVDYVATAIEQAKANDNQALGSYEDIQKRYPNSRKIGRSNVAKCMVDMGYVASVDEALDVYIGSYGEKRAYVPKDIQYVSIEEAISAIIEAGGVAVLAHLYYYGMSEYENDILVKRFKELSGSHGGIEVYYGIYTNQQREILKQIADKYQLMYSAASDYHGQRQRDCLDNKFLSTDCQELLKHLGFGKEWM